MRRLFRVKKAIIIMYNVDVSEIMRYKEMICDYEIVQAVSPNGWGTVGKDAGFVDGGMNIGCDIKEEIDYGIEFDTVFLLTSVTEKLIHQVYNTYLKKAVQEKKQIICTQKVKDILLQLCKDDIVSIDENVDYKVRRMGKIDTPIIVVAGTHEYTQKFKIQLELKRYLNSKGYKVSLVGSKDFTKLFAGHQFPTFMFQNMSERDKILAFQGYIRDIDKKEEPDVIIIGIPGGMMPYNEKFPGYFGITLYEVMLSIQPDAFILSCLFEQYDKEYFQEIKNVVKYRFGVEVDCFNISPFQVDINESDQNDSLQYFKLSQNVVSSMIGNIVNEIPIYNISNGLDGMKMAEFITSRLEEYSEAEFV